MGQLRIGTEVVTPVIVKGNATLTSLTVSPSTTSQTITPASGIDGYDTVTVNAVTAAIDSDIQAGNIKSGVNILGVTGNYSGTQPSGTYTITANGTYDVTNYASADVDVASNNIEVYVYIDQPNTSAYYYLDIGSPSAGYYRRNYIQPNSTTKAIVFDSSSTLDNLLLEANYSSSNPVTLFSKVYISNDGVNWGSPYNTFTEISGGLRTTYVVSGGVAPFSTYELTQTTYFKFSNS